jgi:glycerophosphoryl diester phosphodiesterase
MRRSLSPASGRRYISPRMDRAHAPPEVVLPGGRRGTEREDHGWFRALRSGPLIIGHRGASAHVTENTLSAFERAARDRADGVELDVVCCASGEVVVFHDDDLLRLAGRPDRVASLPWQQLQAVALNGGGRIPLLDQAFEACGPDLLVNVELKSTGLFDRDLRRLIAGVSESIRRCQTKARVIVSSFDPVAVGLWQQARPDVPGAFLFEGGGLVAVGKALALPLLHPAAAHPQASLCRPELVRRWHRLGYRVNTWTVDDPERLRELSAMGVDGIIANDPAAARAALAGGAQ